MNSCGSLISMEEMPVNQEKSELEEQRKNVATLYDEVAPLYDCLFEGKAEYQVPQVLVKTYKKYGIKSGSILDVGCGTGKLKEYLGNIFTYEGVDISEAMIKEAEKRGFKGYVGPIEDVIETFADKSVDHVTALSSVYFIKDFEKLVREFDRVARQSIFVSLEQFEPKIVEMMKSRGITIYNHSTASITNPTEIIKNTFLWKRPNSEDRIFGGLIFKKFSY